MFRHEPFVGLNNRNYLLIGTLYTSFDITDGKRSYDRVSSFGPKLEDLMITFHTKTRGELSLRVTDCHLTLI